MDKAAAARARRGIQRRGHILSFRRGVTRADVKAVAHGYSPTELVVGVTQGTRQLIVSALDLQDAGFPVPLIKGDRIYFGPVLDIPTTISAVDVDHREYQACYDVTTQGN